MCSTTKVTKEKLQKIIRKKHTNLVLKPIKCPKLHLIRSLIIRFLHCHQKGEKKQKLFRVESEILKITSIQIIVFHNIILKKNQIENSFTYCFKCIINVRVSIDKYTHTSSFPQFLVFLLLQLCTDNLDLQVLTI